MSRRAKTNRTPAVAARVNRDPMDAVPVIADGVEARADGQGRLQLRATPPVAPGFRSALARKLGMRRHIRVDLDEAGSRFWRQIDGRRTLRDIERHMREHVPQDAKEIEPAIIQFAKMLMRRHLIWLAIPQETDTGDHGE